jgi:hypothetical protein
MRTFLFGLLSGTLPGVARPQGQRRRATQSQAKPLVEALEDRMLLSLFTVDALTDTGEGSGLTGDLRYALTQAASGDTVRFAVAGTIGLTRPLPALKSGLTITGPGPVNLTVARVSGGDYGIFRVAEGATVVLSGLTIANGLAVYPDQGGGISNPAGSLLWLEDCVVSGNAVTDLGSNVQRDRGGGVWSGGTLIAGDCTFIGNYDGQPGALWGNGGGLANFGNATVTHSTFAGNGGETGAAIYNEGTLTVDTCMITGNTGDTGGGIANCLGTLIVTSSTLADNTAYPSQGGGIFSFYGSADIRTSTLYGNSARYGGGIWNTGPLTASESTICGNHSLLFASAGGIADYTTLNDTTVDLEGCTLSDNTVDSSDRTGSQLFCMGSRMAQATVVLRNTILQGNGEGPNCYAGIGGAVASMGHNLSSDDSGNLNADGDLPNTDPVLGPLQDNGGPTPTMALFPGSPAVGAGDTSEAPSFDQRGDGYARLVQGQIDIGAFEAQVGNVARFIMAAPTNVSSGSPFSVTVTAVDAYGHMVTGYTGTVLFSTTDPNADAVLPPAYTFSAADQGVHTFTASFILFTLGEESISVRDSADSMVAATVGIGVDAA